MSIDERLEEVLQLTHKRNQSIVYQLGDIKEAIFKLCVIVGDMARQGNSEQNWIVKDRPYSEETVRKGTAAGDKRRWKLYPDSKYSGPAGDDWVMSVVEHERQMEVLRLVVRDNDDAFGKMRDQRDMLLKALQDIQLTVWPSDTELFGGSKEAPFEDLDNFVGMIKDEFKKLRKQARDAREEREDMRRAMLAQRYQSPAPDMYVGRGRYDAAVSERNIMREKLRKAWNLAHTLAEALRLTQEYIGDNTLPPKVGWSWYDALIKYQTAIGLDPENHISLGTDEGVDYGDEPS